MGAKGTELFVGRGITVREPESTTGTSARFLIVLYPVGTARESHLLEMADFAKEAKMYGEG